MRILDRSIITGRARDAADRVAQFGRSGMPRVTSCEMVADWRSLFEDTYSREVSTVQERVWREVFGSEYPVGLDPYSYVSNTELQRFEDCLRLQPGDELADLGCGRGGAGLWVAAKTGASLIGVDIAESALKAARARAEALAVNAEFRLGTFEETGLDDASIAGLMSVDALLFTPDKLAALSEFRRIARPGASLVMTSWDYSSQPVNRPPQVADHRPIAELAGWNVQEYEETVDWRARLEQTGMGLLAAAAELAEETKTPIAEVRSGIEEMNAILSTMLRRFLLVATAK